MAKSTVDSSIAVSNHEGGVTACKGFFANGIAAGIKSNGRKDICIIFSREPCDAAAVFTTNRIKAAPIRVSKANLNKKIHAIICNSGNANACTGREGLKNSRTMAKRVGEEFEFPAGSVLVASTGVIGRQLPMETVNYGITKLQRKMIAESSVTNAVDAIMTTDTRRKLAKVTCRIGDKTITIGGIAKGSGMINPNMATMLAFLTTDAAISRSLMQRALRFAVKHTFNKITVDGQMSTNDTVYLLANGTANNPIINRPGQKYTVFEHALTRLCEVLAMEIVNDGEGVTKVITITVKGAPRKPDAEKVARAVGNSPLVKSAFYGQSANWGRIIQAIGASEVAVDPDRIGISINGTRVCENGASCGITQLEGRQLLNRRNIDLLIELGLGSSSDFVITTDLSYDYVKINSQYT